LHSFVTLKHPRWEDFDWERRKELEHGMSWLGNGDVVKALPKDFTHEEMRSIHKVRGMWGRCLTIGNSFVGRLDRASFCGVLY
jgi:hypothetical protein